MQSSTAVIVLLLATAAPIGARRVSTAPQMGAAEEPMHSQDLSANSGKSEENSAKSMVASRNASNASKKHALRLDKDGFCPEMAFGGGEGDERVKRLDKPLIMVKVFYAQHLPSGGGWFKEDIPDLYIKFSVDGVEAQTRLIKNSFNPLFGTTCYFTFAGDANLEMNVYEGDGSMFSEDDLVGHVGLHAQEGLALNEPFWDECGKEEREEGKEGEDFHECAKHLFLFGEDYKNVYGKDGELTKVTVAFKKINPLPQTHFGLPEELQDLMIASSLSQTSPTLTSNEAALVQASNEELGAADGFDRDGNCPEFKVGGNEPNHPMPEKLLMFKVLKVTDLPEDGTWFSKDIPDLYVKFGFDKDHQGQTNMVPNNYNPVFAYHCYFPWSGEETLHLDLWDHDSGAFDSDDVLGHVELKFNSPACHINDKDYPGECYVAFPVGDKDHIAVYGSSGRQTMVHVALKFVQAHPTKGLWVPYNLGM